ncbi:Tma23p [Sugiyamaella lignohabitans]|uniref:Tma23p n=1 Tax=Sugiyamaella lignohabitans TaxID=796027 RepID=A0A167FE99_9ASCO|nr:Tma23p [Sugiyamaella lignohabitans]ANB15189.1 Tma23p [Sugiyamaella lignohabitans]
MDSASYLQSFGWSHGQPLQKGGLRKPILVKHKKDTKGLGHTAGDQEAWWERMFDGQLKGLDVSTSGSSKDGGVTFKQNEIKVSAVSQNVSPLYRMFVRGGVLEGSIPPEGLSSSSKKNQNLKDEKKESDKSIKDKSNKKKSKSKSSSDSNSNSSSKSKSSKRKRDTDSDDSETQENDNKASYDDKKKSRRDSKDSKKSKSSKSSSGSSMPASKTSKSDGSSKSKKARKSKPSSTSSSSSPTPSPEEDWMRQLIRTHADAQTVSA